jgi:hypothetical protein
VRAMLGCSGPLHKCCRQAVIQSCTLAACLAAVFQVHLLAPRCRPSRCGLQAGCTGVLCAWTRAPGQASVLPRCPPGAEVRQHQLLGLDGGGKLARHPCCAVLCYAALFLHALRNSSSSLSLGHGMLPSSTRRTRSQPQKHSLTNRRLLQHTSYQTVDASLQPQARPSGHAYGVMQLLPQNTQATLGPQPQPT